LRCIAAGDLSNGVADALAKIEERARIELSDV
jgi:hypothetical protein